MSSNPDVPPFIGYVETTVNALRLIHAARQGVIPRITRRLNDAERRTMIKSGAVFVFSVEESGIKRWTDGLLWSPSRIVGNFLVYREINERTSSRGSHKKSYPEGSPPRDRALAVRRESPELGFKGHMPASSGRTSTDQGTFKVNGLIKKTITVTIDGSDLHLISYYTSEEIRSGKLKRPSTRPDIMSLYMPPHIFRLTNFRVPPKVEIGPDGKPRLVCEVEDQESNIDCKVEEQNYLQGSEHSPTWSPSSVGSQSPGSLESAFSGTSFYPITHGNPNSSNTYSREGTQDRWPMPLEGLRMSSSSRQGIDWLNSSPSPTSASSTHSHHSLSRRRDSGILPQTLDSWPSLHSQSGRLHGDTYESPGNTVYFDRSRMRSSDTYGTTTAISSHRRENEGMSMSPHRYGGHVAPSHELGSARLPWLTRETPEGDKDTRNSHSGSSFPSSPTLQFAPQGYHSVNSSYGSTWSSNLIDNRSLQSISAHSATIHSYDHAYGSRSGSLSSPEDYSNVEEFGDS